MKQCLNCKTVETRSNIGLTHSAKGTFICIKCVNKGVTYSDFDEVEK